ncbi:SRPBCC family protein [Actinocrispum sp. NPDC049592]|uniref:SRPBCC family protein n=1 Tax=Actinocrispum sp. NPDC049592 TaxID=3154835 RepID=UPI003428E530
MAVDVRPRVLIHRPRTDVAAFMFDPANDLRWTGGITASTPAQAGPLVTGATVERRARFLGRSFTYGYVVTEHDPDRLVELQVERPFPMTVRYELADVDGGTQVTIHASGQPGWFFRWATPLMAKQVHKHIAADLERLRECLES